MVCRLTKRLENSGVEVIDQVPSIPIWTQLLFARTEHGQMERTLRNLTEFNHKWSAYILNQILTRKATCNAPHHVVNHT